MLIRLIASASRAGICSGLLLTCMSLGASTGHAQPAGQLLQAGLSAHAFYAISAQTYAHWCQDTSSDHCSPPARVTRFPAHVQYVGFYFATNYPAQNAGDMTTDVLARFAITIHTSAGVLYTRYAPLGTGTQLGWQESTAYFGDGFALIHAPQIQQDINGSVYPDDTYRADLIIDGKPAAHTTFIVGSGRPAHTVQVHPIIQAFYPATEEGYNTWSDLGTVPQKAATVQGGQQVFFYMRWSNIPAYLPLSIGILDPRQHTLVAHTGLFNVPRPAGYAMYIVVEPDQVPFDPGIYQGEVLFGDTVMAKVSFAIGSSPT